MPTTAHTYNPPTRADIDAHNPSLTDSGADADKNTGYTNVNITAANANDAEKNALAFLDHHHGHDLRGAVATATNTGVRADGAQAWTVHIVLANPDLLPR